MLGKTVGETSEQPLRRTARMRTMQESPEGAGRLVQRAGDAVRGRALRSTVGPPVLRRNSRAAPATSAMFDVFDTVLTRCVSPGPPVWAIAASRLRQQGQLHVDVERFLTARAEAEARAAQVTEHCPAIEEIHAELCHLLGLDDSRVLLMSRLELEAEREVSRVVPAGRARLVAARASGCRVIFISDMYLPSPFIRDLLLEHRCWEPRDSLWVSGEARARKKTGRLFQMVMDTEGIEPSDAYHVGDHPVADRIAPRWMGVRAEPLTVARPTRYERALSDGAHHRALTARMADASRMVRLDRASGEHAEVHAVAADVVGPVLVAYCLWLLRQARDCGHERLYFLSRDGEILHAVAQILARTVGSDVDLRYLYGGRMAWGLAACQEGDRSQLDRLVDDLLFKPSVVTLDGVATRLGEWVRQLDASTTTADRPLSEEERSELAAQLRSPLSIETLTTEAARRRTLTRAYLRQEGLDETARSAIVDVGWVGTTMRMLARLLEPGPPPATLFFGGGAPDSLPGGLDAYLWGGKHGDNTKPTPPFAGTIEMFCSGSHGAVLGYDERDGLITPRLAGPRSIVASGWPLDDMQATVREYARAVGASLSSNDLDVDVRSEVTAVLSMFRHSPSPGEARAWGPFPREEDPQGVSVFPMARPFSFRMLGRVIRPGPFAGRNLAWPEAALQLTPPLQRGVASLLLSTMSGIRRVRG